MSLSAMMMLTIIITWCGSRAFLATTHFSCNSPSSQHGSDEGYEGNEVNEDYEGNEDYEVNEIYECEVWNSTSWGREWLSEAAESSSEARISCKRSWSRRSSTAATRRPFGKAQLTGWQWDIWPTLAKHYSSAWILTYLIEVNWNLSWYIGWETRSGIGLVRLVEWKVGISWLLPRRWWLRSAPQLFFCHKAIQDGRQAAATNMLS